MSKTFTHETDTNRYVLRIDDELIAVVDYVINGNSISFTHTFTNPTQRGRGYAGEIVEFAVNDVDSSSDRHIVPMCWYVGEWFDKHPERAALLARGT
ncbi:MAG: N-acetyltransferase [Glaciihabitans sp.]|nr:N-acetyltransferase [Glaciihabitans sp.]